MQKNSYTRIHRLKRDFLRREGNIFKVINKENSRKLHAVLCLKNERRDVMVAHLMQTILFFFQALMKSDYERSDSGSY